MAVYSINYDLQQPRRDYPAIWDAILRVDPEACHVQGSLWFVSIDATPLEVDVFLQSFLDNDDLLFVSEIVDGGWASKSMPNHALIWLALRFANVRSFTIPEAIETIRQQRQYLLGSGSGG